jgi:hypothetical protein
MRYSQKAVTILIISVLMLTGLLSVVSAIPAEGAAPTEETRSTYTETGDETRSFASAKELMSGDVYYGGVNRVDDRADYFKVDAVQQEVINAHMYITGHDGENTWQTGTNPPTPGRETGIFATYLYAGPELNLGIDGAFNYLETRHYVLNICAPVPGTNTYYINISLDWFMTPNNFTWEYSLEIDISHPDVITSGGVATDTIDLERRDTHWYKIYAKFEDEVNGSVEITNFDFTDPTERNLNIWIFPDDLGGYPFSFPWDWSAAPNEELEPVSVMSTYEGWFFIKIRGMNHTNSLPNSYRLEMYTHQVPEFPETGIQNMYFDRFRHDSDWYKFEMKANQPHHTKPGYWNEVVYFNMTERADAEDLPDFDLYLFGRIPGSRWLDLLDSSFRNDHPDFFDPNRDPNKNTEDVKGAAFYNGTYYVEVNAWNNTGYYDLRREWKESKLSDMDNLPENAKLARAGVYESHIHQATDHYDWYKVEARESVRIQFDSFKGTDLFNASLYKYDAIDDEYVLIKGGWNTWFNFTSREDHIGNLIDFTVNLDDFGLGAGTYYIGVFAAVAAEMAFDQVTSRAFLYKTDRDAETNYELRIWVDNVPPFTRPPQIIKPIPDLIVDEDTDKLDFLDLYDYFIDTDIGDEVLRFKAQRINNGLLSSLYVDQQAGTLGFEAAEDFSGKVVVKVTAIDRKYLANSLTWNITFLSVNDPPKPKYDTSEPYIYTMPEDSIRQFDFKTLVRDVDKQDEVNITWPESAVIDISIDPDTLVAEFVGVQDWYGEETIIFTARDLVGDTTPLPVTIVVENVEDNPVVIKQIGERSILEDTFETLSMTEYFQDPDGDDLTFSLSNNLNIEYVVDLDTWVMTLTPDANWYGFREIWVTAVDTTGRTAQTRFNFEVAAENDPPVISSWSPAPLEVTVKEEASQSFVVLNVSDPEFSILIYKWYLDGKLVGPSNFYNYRPGYLEQGIHELRVEVTDEEGETDDLRWTITVVDVPRPPEGGVASPANNAKFFTNEKIPFVGLFYDLDGDELSYQWYVDGKPASSEFAFDKRLDEGKHEVRLDVQSGDFTVRHFSNITVEQADSPGFEAPLVFTGLVVTFIAAAAWRRRRM